MKRIHLAEIEDQAWFPNWLRTPLTRLIVVMHRFLGTSKDVADLLADGLRKTKATEVVDLCSGSGGPMLDVMSILEEKHGFEKLPLTMTDLYPNLEVAQEVNSNEHAHIQYKTEAVDATNISKELSGFRTMICSFHHLKPEVAKEILHDAQQNKAPILIYEMSDNSAPIFLWWIALPINFLMCFIVTFFVRPITWKQILFTIIPILPLVFAWDGALSNARTYTLDDMDELLDGLESDNYTWTKSKIAGKPAGKLYLMGLPI